MIRNRVAKTTGLRTKPSPEPSYAFRDRSRILNLTAQRHLLTFSTHGSALKRGEQESRLPILTTHPRCCTMWSTMVPWTALNFRNNPNKFSQKLRAD